MTACFDCGQIHRTGLDGIRCDLEHHGKPYVRRRLVDLGLTDQQIDGLIDEAGRRPDDGFVNGGYMVRGLNDLAAIADPTPPCSTCEGEGRVDPFPFMFGKGPKIPCPDCQPTSAATADPTPQTDTDT